MAGLAPAIGVFNVFLSSSKRPRCDRRLSLIKRKTLRDACDEPRKPAAYRPLSAQHDAGLPGSWRDAHGRVRVFCPHAAAAARILAGGRARTGARLSGEPALLRW